MQNEQIEKFLEYLSRDPVLQRDLARRARSPEQFYANAARFARLFGYSFSADELKAWVGEFRGGDLLKLAQGNSARTGDPQPDAAREPALSPEAKTSQPDAANPLRAA